MCAAARPWNGIRRRATISSPEPGGSVVGPGGAPLTYGHEDRGYRNGPFAAIGDVALAPRLDLPVAASAA